MRKMLCYNLEFNGQTGFQYIHMYLCIQIYVYVFAYTSVKTLDTPSQVFFFLPLQLSTLPIDIEDIKYMSRIYSIMQQQK